VRLIEEVRSGALDCAIGLITSEHAVPAGMHAASVGSESVVVVAAKSARSRSEGKVRLRDLAGEVWILNPVGCGCRAALERAFDRAQTPMRVAAEVFGEDLQLSLIARGAGFGLVPRRQLDHSPHRARLRIVKLADFTLRGAITMLHGPSLGSLATAVDQLRTQIAGELKNYR
jgi:DNA-binding transcriptional LysR family regulator